MSGLRAPRHGQLFIGRGVFINYDCYFDLNDDIAIGDNVFIANHVRLITTTHEVGFQARRAGAVITQPIRIEEGAWVGSSATVLPGVTIGRGCVVAAGSVVLTDCEPNSLYAGVPATKKKEL